MEHLHYVGNNLVFRNIQALVNEYINFVKESKLPMEKHYVLGVGDVGRRTEYITDKESIGKYDIVKIEGFELYKDQCRPYLKSLVNEIVPNGKGENSAIKIRGKTPQQVKAAMLSSTGDKIAGETVRKIYDSAVAAVSGDCTPDPESVSTITGHVFISKKDAVSFPLHRDPATVLITMIKGEKDFIVDYEDNGDYKVFTVKEGEVLVIPENVVHMALNTHDSVMLSIGIEKSLYLQEQGIRALEAGNAVY